MKSVIFSHNHGGFNAGDRALVSSHEAASLVKHGLATYSAELTEGEKKAGANHDGIAPAAPIVPEGSQDAPDDLKTRGTDAETMARPHADTNDEVANLGKIDDIRARSTDAKPVFERSADNKKDGDKSAHPAVEPKEFSAENQEDRVDDAKRESAVKDYEKK